MTKQRLRRFAPPLLLLALQLSGAPAPKLIRDIDLNGLIRESAGWNMSNHPVKYIAFSPDESRIALVVGSHWKEGPVDPIVGLHRMSHVVVVALKETKEQVVQIDVEKGLGSESLQWSPGSAALGIDTSPPQVFTIPSGEPVRYEPRGAQLWGFVAADQWLMSKVTPTGVSSADLSPAARLIRANMPFVYDTLDLEGRLLSEWPTPQWIIEAVNPDRHLLLMEKQAPGGPRRFVIDYRTKAIVQEWPNGGPFWKSYFAEAGKSLCSVGESGRDARSVECFEIDSGKKIAEFAGFKGGDPAGVSSHASRLVLNHIRLLRGITEEFDRPSYKDRVVWDFRANKEIGEWVPATQTEVYYNKDGNRTVRNWGPFAISPTGRFLAEGSNGVLRVYELP